MLAFAFHPPVADSTPIVSFSIVIACAQGPAAAKTAHLFRLEKYRAPGAVFEALII
jgi:hypothetical protein